MFSITQNFYIKTCQNFRFPFNAFRIKVTVTFKNRTNYHPIAEVTYPYILILPWGFNTNMNRLHFLFVNNAEARQ